jgi:SNF2 family DNA or RNA helicase
VSAVLERAAFTPARDLPGTEPFYSPLGLFDFQADGVAHTYGQFGPDGAEGVITVFDTGIGKTIMFCALAAFMIADGEMDQAIVLCERNKVRDWRKAFETFTNLSVVVYHGTGRQRRLERHVERHGALPHVLVTTYETGARELHAEVKQPGRRGKVSQDGPLVATLGLRTRRSLWGADECTKWMNRGSKLYAAYEYLFGQLRREGMRPRIAGYTATPFSKNFEQAFNIGRIICPSRMPTMKRFYEHFCDGQNKYGDWYMDRDHEDEFAELFRDIMLRKRKTDPDVVDQFPATVEKAIHVEFSTAHKRFYQMVGTLLDPVDPQNDPRSEYQIDIDDQRTRMLLRMSAGHPASHVHAKNDTSKLIVDILGEDELRKIGTSKLEPLITSYLKPICKGQGDQVVMFTHFTSVLKEVCRELQAAGFRVATYHGGQTDKSNHDAEDSFQRGDVDILLCSDAAMRGLNLQAGSYCIEYDSASSFADRTQRLNRIHRLDSTKTLVTFYTMVLEDSVEVDIIETAMNRNEKHDRLVGDEEDETAFVSADTRRERLGLQKK